MIMAVFGESSSRSLNAIGTYIYTNLLNRSSRLNLVPNIRMQASRMVDRSYRLLP